MPVPISTALPLPAQALFERDIHNLENAAILLLNNCDGIALRAHPHLAACQVGGNFAVVRVGLAQQGHVRVAYIAFVAAGFRLAHAPL